MISRHWSRTPIALTLAAAILSVYSMVALAAPQQGQAKASAEVTVSGEVMVDGVKAISGGTLFSGSTVSTAQNSSAIITGKFGRVELLPNSSMKFNFSDNGLNGSLDAGRTRVSTPAGVATNVATKDGAVVADSAQAAMFSVDVECGNTIVANQAGKVELRSGNQAKQIAAGSQDTAGAAAPGTRCARLPASTGPGAASGGALAALLAAAGGAIAAAIIAARSNSNDLNFGGNVTVISPTS